MAECFFFYQPTWVVPDQGPLNGCVCVCACACVCVVCVSVCLSVSALKLKWLAISIEGSRDNSTWLAGRP